MRAPFKEAHWAQRDLLAKSPLFSGLPESSADELAAASRLLELPPRHYLFRAGEPIREAHLLVSGSVRRSTTLAGGRKKVIELAQAPQLLAPGEIFGGPRYASSCEVIASSVALAIDLRRLRALLARDLDLAGRIVQALADRLCAVEFDVTGHHYSLTGTQRLLDYLLELAGEPTGLAGETTVVLKASKTLIAARIGMTPESLSRNLRQLSDSGVIVVEGRKVHIQNAALLDTENGGAARRLNFSRRAKVDKAQPPKVLPGALINLCGRLRVLSQRLASAWALIASDITPSTAAVRLRRLDGEFARHLARLERLALPAPLAEDLQAVGEIWQRFRPALLAEAPAGPAAPAQMLALSEEILAATDALTGHAERLAATPGARYVNLAGRNRMLSQRISKLFLFRAWPACRDSALAQHEVSCAEFESNLDILRQSGKALPQLAAQLEEVAAQWQKFSRALEPSLPYLGKSHHARGIMTEGERLLRHVDTTVKLYERLSK